MQKITLLKSLYITVVITNVYCLLYSNFKRYNKVARNMICDINTSKFNGDVIEPIDTEQPIGTFVRRQHPLTPPVSSNDSVQSHPIQTNKFYANLMIGDQTSPAYVYPYSVWLTKDPGFHGIAITQVSSKTRVFGPDPNVNPVKYYLNPVGITHFVFSAEEMSSEISMKLDSIDHLSVNVNLFKYDGRPIITLPLVRGMGMVTAKYHLATPIISSKVGFEKVEPAYTLSSGVQKYQVKLFDGDIWFIYISLPNGESLNFKLKDNNHLVGTNKCNAVIQIAKLPNSDSVSALDDTAGTYATSASLSANVDKDGLRGSYNINFTHEGKSLKGLPLMFALEHQIQAMPNTNAIVTPAKLDSQTKGVMTGFITNKFNMVEQNLPRDIGFLPEPFLEHYQSKLNKKHVIDLIYKAAYTELEQNIDSQTMLDSLYFSGKAIDKFANILLVLNDILHDQTKAQKLLSKLKDIFAVYTSGNNKHPLVYDITWGGIISSAGLNGNPFEDFGSSNYNDHHFHYSYFIHAAAVIAKVDQEIGDGKWLLQNKKWVEALIRDVANPSSKDVYFPISRYFDWFSGHSWAKGLFPSLDGKDQESSSEDVHFAYSMKLWGCVSGNKPMESYANLILAIMKRSMNIYFLMRDNNKNQPQQFIKNKVPGIVFENKVDFATYFGLNPEYILGIHMIPTTPISPYIRIPPFVKEEWNEKIGEIIDTVNGGWRGVLQLDRAIFDPFSSFAFFSKDFLSEWLDQGMSLTWSLAIAAGMGGE